MRVSDILALPRGVKEVDSVEAVIGFVNKVEHKEGTAKTGKNVGKPYSFYVQNLSLMDGEQTIYANLTFKNEEDSVPISAKGSEISIKDTTIDYYKSKKDGKEHKCLKGGHIVRDENVKTTTNDVKTTAKLDAVPQSVWDKKDLFIAKQTCLKVAAEFAKGRDYIKSPTELTEIAQILLDYIYSGAKEPEYKDVQELEPAENCENQGDEDIPF